MNLELVVTRFSSGKDDTLGMLHINGKFACFTLEDERRDTKVWGEMCVPCGKYNVTLYRAGKFHAEYSTKFKSIHKGMLLVNDVPGFEAILIHIGNTDKDTAGCLLVGDQIKENVTGKGLLSSSTTAYTRVYPQIADVLAAGDKVTIEYKTVA